MADNKDRKEGLGLRWLYHVTDECNILSILENMCLCSWADMGSFGIKAEKTGGNPVTRALDKRNNLDGYVHLFMKEPSSDMIDALKEQGSIENPVVLRVSVEAIGDSSIFTAGNVYDEAGRVIDTEELKSGEIFPEYMVHVRRIIPLKYIDNIPSTYLYKASSLHPTALMFIIDHSESMSRSTDICNRHYDYMSDAVAEAVNRQIEKLIEKSKDEKGTIQDKFDIAVIGYGSTAYSAWAGELNGQGFVHLSEIAARKGPDKAFPWVEPRDDGRGSHSERALETAYDLLVEWMDNQKSPYYYPPMVIHITDGEVSTENKKSFIRFAEKIKKMKTADGNVLLWNLNITPFRQSEFLLPTGADLPALFNTGLELFEASSILPEAFHKEIAAITGNDDDLPHRALAVNIGVDTMSKLIDMSTSFLQR